MKYFYSLSLLALFPAVLFSQLIDIKSPSLSNFENNRASLNMVPEMEIGFPLGDFQEKLDKTLIVGKGIAVFYRMKTAPVDFGIRIGDFSYDKVSRRFTDPDGISLINKSKNKIWNWYGVFRFEPETKLGIRPYFEGSFGFSRYYSKTSFRETGINLFREDLNIGRFDKSTLNSDWGATYGGAIGFYYSLYKNFLNSLDIQIGYRSRGLGKFLVKKDGITVQEEPLDNFEERRSKMTLLSFKIGISILGFTE